MSRQDFTRTKGLVPASSGYISRCHGIVGSTNGRGVPLSIKRGRLIATFEPLRFLMLAVSVLLGSQEGIEGDIPNSN